MSRRCWVAALACLALAAPPAQALPRTGAYLALSPSSPKAQVVLNLYDGVLEITWVPRHTFDGTQNRQLLVGSVRFPLQIIQEHDNWPAVTALIGYQRQQGANGNATNAAEFGFKADKAIFPWMSVHALVTNSAVFLASTPQGNVPSDLLVMPRIEIGASFQPAPPVHFLIGFQYWSGPEQINLPTTFMRSVRGYPALLLGINWQFSDLFGLPEPSADTPGLEPSPVPSVIPTPSPPATPRP